LVAIDAHESVVEVVKTVVNKGDVTYHNAPRAVDVDATKGLNPEAGEPIAVEGRVHPVFLGDVENVIVSLNYTGWHGRCVDILDHAKWRLWTARRWRRRQRYGEAETSDK
jgi:hypothetical protein